MREVVIWEMATHLVGMAWCVAACLAMGDADILVSY